MAINAGYSSRAGANTNRTTALQPLELTDDHALHQLEHTNGHGGIPDRISKILFENNKE